MAHKLLLADDSVTIQRVIELTFADEDVQVISVGDGRQAMERIAQERPDIVLADVGMPHHDGYEVARFIKSDPSLAHIPVLLLTGAFEPVDEPKARAAGCDGVLAKPFEPQMLIARVKELLLGDRRVRPAQEPASMPAPAAASRLAAVPPTRVHQPAPAGPTPDVRPVTGSATPDLSLDAYFDRLDAAFADLRGALPAAEVTPGGAARSSTPARVDTPVRIEPEYDAPHQEVDLSAWIQPKAPPAASVTPLAPADASVAGMTPATPGTATPRRVQPFEVGTPTPAPDQGVVPDLAPAGSAAPPAAQASAEPAARRQEPQLGDAFAAFLASERGEPIPSSLAADFAPAMTISDELVQAVTRRVLERLTDRAVRETVADIVSEVAERVVREEIARLKASLR